MTTSAVPVSENLTPESVPGPRRGFVPVLALCVGSVYGVLLAASILTLSIAATAVDAARATSVLSTAVAVGGVAQLLAYPVIGRLSDRTTSGLGRRRPFLLGGAAVMALGGGLQIAAHSTLLLTLSYVVLSLGAVSALVAANAIVPDQLPADRRGPASAAIGLGAPIGAVVGIFLAQLGQPTLGLMVLFPTALGVLAAIGLALFVQDRPVRRAVAPGPRIGLSTFWVNPLRHPGFAFAWVSRFCIFLGVSAVNAYQAFYLIIVQHTDPATVGTRVLVASLVGTGVALVLSPVAGRVSDRLGRRKPFVVAAALIFAAGLWLTAQAGSFGGFLVAVAVIGLGQSVYFAVDFALITEVLPNPDDTAKDLGLMNLAMSLPSSVVPAVAPAILAVGAAGNNFSALFGAGAVAAVVGALAVLPIRGVR
ncbi:MFS transporter [Kineosporia sp. J2-2]|uniref:MFS transporter n=1 Tax=Kineosporia corallincola TaxID=2835133 RepID=A0ABS5TRF4_9ACTN|nr:MFS transporter [Kineosporia corallincola]MBT0773373.1 MFS transporter [Kineosporia corallincola]